MSLTTKRFQGWKTVSKGFAKRVLESDIIIVDCDGCTLNKQGRRHILDSGMELSFEKSWRQTGEIYEGVYGLQDIRLLYEAEDNEIE